MHTFEALRRNAAPRAKCPRSTLTKDPSSKDLTCEGGRRVVAAPDAVEPAVVPAPHPAVEVQIAYVQEAVGVAVNGSPEEDVAHVAFFVALPVLRDEMLVLIQGVENVPVENRLADQLFVQFIALDQLVVHLPLGPMKDDFDAETVSTLFHRNPAFANVLLYQCTLKGQLRRESEVDIDRRIAHLLPERFGLRLDFDVLAT